MMRRFIWLLPLILLLSGGFRTTGYRSDNTIYGDMTFADSVAVDDNFVVTGAADVDSVNTDHLVVNTNAVPATDTMVSFGGATLRPKEVWAFRFRGTDGAKADSFSIFDSGSATYFTADNQITFSPSGGARWAMGVTSLRPQADTLYMLGESSARPKEVWGLRLQWSDGSAADSGKVYDDGTNSRFLADNPFIIDHLLADTLQVQIMATGAAGAAGYATTFVDTTGTDSLIIMVGSTRRGIAIE